MSTTDKLRNVCLMSHGGTGKTSLTEAMLFNAGASDRLGKVVDGNTVTDYDPEEIKRKISISTSVACCDWKGHKINLIDTPGYFDFIGEVYQGVRSADACIIPVAAKSGNQAGVEKAWDFAKNQKIAKVFFVNKMDEPNSDFNNVLEGLKKLYGTSLVPFTLPIISGETLKGYVDVMAKKAYEVQNGKSTEVSIPADLAGQIDGIFDSMKEAIAETDEDLLEKFLSGDDFTKEEFEKGLKSGKYNESRTCCFICI